MRGPNGIFYGWSMVAVAVLLMVVAVAPLWIGLPLWNPLLESVSGWFRPWRVGVTEVVLLLILVAVLVLPLLAMVEGLLVDKLGPRRMVLIGLAMLGFGLALGSLVEEGWLLYAAFMLVVLGSPMGGWMPMMKMLNNWFDRRKTMAIGVALGGFGLAELFGPFFLTFGLLETDLYETVYLEPGEFKWGAVTLAVGLLYVALAFPLSRLVRDRPEDLGLLPDGDAPPLNAQMQADPDSVPPPEADWGHTWPEAVRTKNFWLLTIGHGSALVTLGTLPVYLALFLDGRDHSVVMAGLVTGAATLLAAVFTFVGGYLGDKFAIRKVAFGFSALLGLSVVVLVTTSGTGMLFVFAALFGIGMGGGTAIVVAMRGRYFGRRAFATITNLSLLPPEVLLAAAPTVVTVILDWRWQYEPAFLALAAITLVGGIAFLMMGEPPTQRPSLPVDDAHLKQPPVAQPIP